MPRYLVVRIDEADLEDHSQVEELFEEPLRAAAILPNMDDESLSHVMGALSRLCGAVSRVGENLVVPSDSVLPEVDLPPIVPVTRQPDPFETPDPEEMN